MNEKGLLFNILRCMRNPHEFTAFVQKAKWRHILWQFLIVLCLLYLPLFASIIRTQPAELYERLFSEQFDNLKIQEFHGQCFSGDLPEASSPAIYIFDDYTVYRDVQVTLTAPSKLISLEGTLCSFEDIFSMIAVYNGYIPQLLIPILLSVCAVICVLQILFYLLSAGVFSLHRMDSSHFSFFTGIKISISISILPAIAGLILGFLLPGVHIILYQVLSLLILFIALKRHVIPKAESFPLSNSREHGNTAM